MRLMRSTRGFARDPTTLDGHDDGHDPEAGATDGGLVVRRIARVSYTGRARGALAGCAPSQKKLEVWRCTTSSSCSSGSFASAAAFHQISYYGLHERIRLAILPCFRDHMFF